MALKFILIFSLLFFFQSTYALNPSLPALEDKYNTVVSIRNYAPDQDGNDAPAFCVATLVSASELITAAHCVKDLYFHPDLKLTIDIGYYKYVTRPNGQTVRVGYLQDERFEKNVSIRFPQSLMRKIPNAKKKVNIGPDEDIALIRLSSPLEMKREIFFSKIMGSKMKGQYKNFQLNPVTINFIEEMSSDTRRVATLDKVTINSNHFKSTSQSRVAPGDSGAPVFMELDQQLYLSAVVKGRATTVFSNWDVYTLATKFLCEEERHIQCGE